MSKVFFFNPDSDLSLAYEAEMRRRGLKRAVYTPKPRAHALARSLGLLPAWLASGGDYVLVNGDAEYCAQLQQFIDRHTSGITITNRAPTQENLTFMPWGWCNTVVSRLQNHFGASASQLPHGTCEASVEVAGESFPSQLEALAWLSSRERTIHIHRSVTQLLGRELCPSPVMATLDEAEQFINTHPQGCYIKKLWSGSGQGIFHVLPTTRPRQSDLWQWLSGETDRVGHVICEPAYDHKIMDMAVEFECHNGIITLMGYSIFNVDNHNQWTGTVVDTSEHLRERIIALYPHFDEVVHALTTTLRRLIPQFYTGYVGLDMMLYRDENDRIVINPCVEMNFRCTMGVVAAALGNRHHLRGTLTIVPTSTLLSQGKQSAIPLTPPLPSSPFTAILKDCK